MRKTLLAGVAALALSLGLAAPSAQAGPEHGGQMIVTYKDDVSTLDPAIGYDWQNWSMIKSLFDGLMDYEPGSTVLRPDLAESYSISDDGLTYTFILRDGVKFHNGREMTADDVKYSLERVVNPATQSPGQGFFWSIEGFDDMAAGNADNLSGVTVIDPKTVEIKLSQPDATFLHVMAINFSFVVPKEAVEEHGADFGTHPVGTGAFMMTDWTLGQHVIFERNPDYYDADLPRLDRIEFQVGQEPSVALLRLQRDEVDILGDGIPPAQFLEVMDSEWKDNVIEGGQLHTGYITMNTRMAPFDNQSVRQAVNMAINKDRIVQIVNGRAVPANQPLPPAMPGYDNNYEGYAYDPEAAKALVGRGRVRRRVRHRTLCHEHRPEPAYRPGDSAGSGGDRHQRRDQVAGAIDRYRGRRRGRSGADDLVGRHGVDRRLPGSLQLLRPDPGLWRCGAGWLELGVVL